MLTRCRPGVCTPLSHLSSVLTAVQKNDRMSVSSTENSAIESQPQTVSQNSSFSEMTTENTDRVSVNACQDTDTLVQPCLATTVGLAIGPHLTGVQRLLYRKYTRHGKQQCTT